MGESEPDPAPQPLNYLRPLPQRPPRSPVRRFLRAIWRIEEFRYWLSFCICVAPLAFVVGGFGFAYGLAGIGAFLYATAICGRWLKSHMRNVVLAAIIFGIATTIVLRKIGRNVIIVENQSGQRLSFGIINLAPPPPAGATFGATMSRFAQGLNLAVPPLAPGAKVQWVFFDLTFSGEMSADISSNENESPAQSEAFGQTVRQHYRGRTRIIIDSQKNVKFTQE